MRWEQFYSSDEVSPLLGNSLAAQVKHYPCHPVLTPVAGWLSNTDCTVFLARSYKKSWNNGEIREGCALIEAHLGTKFARILQFLVKSESPKRFWWFAQRSRIMSAGRLYPKAKK